MNLGSLFTQVFNLFYLSERESGQRNTPVYDKNNVFIIENSTAYLVLLALIGIMAFVAIILIFKY